MVYVISKSGKPLMPCKPVIARLLLKSKKAKVVKREPFTIKLLVDSTEYTQPLTLGVDTGSGTAGFAVSDDEGRIVYLSEVTLRDDIKRKMDRRRAFRKGRRNRKVRYRKCRFLNRRNSTRIDRFSPTMISKIHSHFKEIEYIKSVLPITTLVLETGKFDTAKLANPDIAAWGYQHGPDYGFENTRMTVLARDKYTCQYCKGRTKDSKLEVHHIVFRSQGGANTADNLITLCHTCHSRLHKGEVKLSKTGKRKDPLSYATQMSSIRKQLLQIYPEAIETYGYITAANRKVLGYDKMTHWLDASLIVTAGRKVTLDTSCCFIKFCVPAGSMKLSRGAQSEILIQPNKVAGFNTFDKVRYRGKEYFIRGKDFRGNCILMDCFGSNVDFSALPRGFRVPKFKYFKRISARSTTLVGCTSIL